MTTSRIEEILVLSKDAWDMSYDLKASQVKLDQALTEAHQAGRDEAETQILQEIMDDLTILHKRKEIDDNGFCTVRDLLHSKALQDNK